MPNRRHRGKRTELPSEHTWRRAARLSPFLYCILSILLIAQQPGPQYDEVLPAGSTVHVAESHARNLPALPHEPGTWLCIRARCLPLMTLRYVGALKEYLYLPFYYALGPCIETFRLCSMALGAIGIWGLAELLGAYAGWRIAAIAGLILAISPAYINQVVFDSGLIATWMAATGLLAAAFARYRHRSNSAGAFWIGLAAGFGVWARANFVWLLASISVALLVIAPRELWRRRHQAPALVTGTLLGCLPFLIYQWTSRGGSWQALSMYPSEQTFADQLRMRSILFAEVLLSDREHRAMWNGPAMPEWQRLLFPAILMVSFMLCLRARDSFARIMAISTLGLIAILFLSRLAISEHHLVAAVPFACALVALATRAIPRWPARVAGALYLACAAYWHVAAIGALHETGGVGLWSDASLTLTRHLESKFFDRPITFLDWGLQNQVYFLTRGRIRLCEIFGDTTRAETGETWPELVRQGGVFVLNSEGHRQFPSPASGFQKAVAEMRSPARRIRIYQRDGSAFTDIFDVTPLLP